MPGVSDFFLGTPGRTEQFQKFNPQQQNALSGLLQQGQEGLANPTKGFQPIADQARTQFQQSTIPSLAERFSSFGGGNNALSSPAFAGQLGQAGAGLEGLLAALQSQYGQQQQSHFSNLLGMGLQPQFENAYFSRQPGFLENAGQGIAGLLPLLGLLLGGPAGGAIGGVGGAGLSSLLSSLGGGQ